VIWARYGEVLEVIVFLLLTKRKRAMFEQARTSEGCGVPGVVPFCKGFTGVVSDHPAEGVFVAAFAFGGIGEAGNCVGCVAVSRGRCALISDGVVSGVEYEQAMTAISQHAQFFGFVRKAYTRHDRKCNLRKSGDGFTFNEPNDLDGQDIDGSPLGTPLTFSANSRGS
jgi:hypothetical protein